MIRGRRRGKKRRGENRERWIEQIDVIKERQENRE